MVAAQALKRGAWLGAAGLAASLIMVLAWHGRRPDPGLVRFVPAGVMRHLAPEDVLEVRVRVGDRLQSFARSAAEGWHTAGTLVSEERARRLDSGLRFLYVSAPQRIMQPEEYRGAALAEFGLDPPQYSVEVRGATGAPFVIHYGATHPQGLAQYTRIGGNEAIVLLPRFVGEPWEALVP